MHAMKITEAARVALLGVPLVLQQLIHLPVSGKWLDNEEYAALLVAAGANGTTASDISGLFQQRTGHSLGAGTFGVWRDSYKPPGAKSQKKYVVKLKMRSLLTKITALFLHFAHVPEQVYHAGPRRRG